MSTYWMYLDIGCEVHILRIYIVQSLFWRNGNGLAWNTLGITPFPGRLGALYLETTGTMSYHLMS